MVYTVDEKIWRRTTPLSSTAYRDLSRRPRPHFDANLASITASDMAQPTLAEMNDSAAFNSAPDAQVPAVKRKRDAEGDDDMQLGEDHSKNEQETLAAIADDGKSILHYVGALEKYALFPP